MKFEHDKHLTETEQKLFDELLDVKSKDEFTFTISLLSDDILTKINVNRLGDKEMVGDVIGITNEKVVIESDDGYIVLDDDFWLSHYGGCVVTNVWIDGEYVKAELINHVTIRRWASNIVEDESMSEYLELLKGGFNGVFNDKMLSRSIEIERETNSSEVVV